MPAVILHTERLVLRPFRPDDRARFETFATSKEYLRHLGDHPGPAQLVAANLGVEGAWVVELDGRVIGSAFLGDELACLLDPDVHGRGFGLEVARALIADGFGRRGYAEIRATAADDNIASVRSLARLGFTPCGGGAYVLAHADHTD
jgi:RimJ/RimL family protein N-acetyltransferase